MQITMRLTNEISRFDSGQGHKMYLFYKVSKLPMWHNQSPDQVTPWIISPGVKWPLHEDDQ